VWGSIVHGRLLHFRLYGINNQNFIMRDQETGTWWQQVSGKAILGPLKGKQLELIPFDELSFLTWRREHPGGRVLRPDPQIASLNKYAPANWEERIARLPTVTSVSDEEPFPPREIILGIQLNGASKVYPLAAIQEQILIVDRVGGVSLMVVQGEDRLSIRAFETTVDGRNLDFFTQQGSSPMKLVDSKTASEWNFEGEAVFGPLKGKRLKKVAILKDFWFDWKQYHPETAIYLLGET
jgi:Protein of unknown function (DUF3179)